MWFSQILITNIGSQGSDGMSHYFDRNSMARPFGC